MGIARYWIVDPKQRSVEMLRLGADGAYQEEGWLGAGDVLTTPLFPGLAIPLSGVFQELR